MKTTVFRTALCAAFAVLASCAVSAPARGSKAALKKDPVAKGYLDWEGFSGENFLFGHPITASDMRHRALVYIVIDASTFSSEQARDLNDLTGIARVDRFKVWDTDELQRERIVVFSVRNAPRDLSPKTFEPKIRPPKGSTAEERLKYTGYDIYSPPIYKDVGYAGEPDIPVADMPYVAVYGGTGTEPLFKKSKYSHKSDGKALNAAVKKARAELGPWKEPLGVAEPKFHMAVPGILDKGKPASAALKLLVAGIKSNDEEQSKEAQIMYDALYQYQSTLKYRLILELDSAPARAYVDYQRLIGLFPGEKKNLDRVTAALGKDGGIAAAGKILEKIMLWEREDFVCKNAGEAKKIVVELKKLRKTLDALAKSSNAALQGEVMLSQGRVDNLVDVIPTKVSVK